MDDLWALVLSPVGHLCKQIGEQGASQLGISAVEDHVAHDVDEAVDLGQGEGAHFVADAQQLAQIVEVDAQLGGDLLLQGAARVGQRDACLLCDGCLLEGLQVIVV